MNGFHKVLKFNVFESYNNARKIADEIIESLVNNTSLKNEEKEYLPTYTSTVRESFLSVLGGSVDCGDKDSDNITKDEDEEIADYVIRIYEVRGNRKSRLSVTQNKQLREIVFK